LARGLQSAHSVRSQLIQGYQLLVSAIQPIAYQPQLKTQQSRPKGLQFSQLSAWTQQPDQKELTQCDKESFAVDDIVKVSTQD
jgi:hypothetical protein